MSRSALQPLANLVLLEESNNIANRDLVPMPPSRRLWGWQSYAGLWTMNGLCFAAWAAASSLLSLDLNVPHSIGVMIVSNLLITSLATICGQIGADWHIGFAMTQRVVFGNRLGSLVTIVVRIIMSIVSFATNSWTGALCLNCVLSSFSKSYLNMKNTIPEHIYMTTQECVGYVIYMVITLTMVFIKPERLGRHLIFCSVATFFVSMGITIWCVVEAGGNGPLVSENVALSKSGVAWAWLQGISSFYGSMASGISNQNDYSRYARSRHSPQWSVHISFNVFGLVIPVMGVIAYSAMLGKYNQEFWMPNEIITFWMQENYSAKARAGAFFAGISFTYSQLLYNVAGNAVSGGMDLSSLVPKVINIRRGSILTVLLSVAVQPWIIYNSSSTFQSVMSSFSVFFTPLIAVLISDYWIIRGRKIKLRDLYDVSPDSIYHYWHQVNFRALFAWAIGFVWAVPGLAAAVTPSLSISEAWIRLYDLNWIVGFAISFAVNSILAKIFPPAGLGEVDEYDYLNTFRPEECEALGMLPFNPEIVKGEPQELQLAVVETHPELEKELSNVDDELVQVISSRRKHG